MMYCTGGVRCERASALVKSLGPEFQNVSQLKGGSSIHCLLFQLRMLACNDTISISRDSGLNPLNGFSCSMRSQFILLKMLGSGVLEVMLPATLLLAQEITQS